MPRQKVNENGNNSNESNYNLFDNLNDNFIRIFQGNNIQNDKDKLNNNVTERELEMSKYESSESEVELDDSSII